jgi:uncharacterized SAM-binding protein YcdF (DUF218 family)
LSIFASPPARQAAIGALLGALIGAGLNVLGFTDALKLGVDLLIPGALLGAVVGLTRLRGALPVIAALVVLGMAIVSYTPVASRLAASLIRGDVPGGTPPDAIAVLSGGMNDDSTMGPITLDRLLTGIELARKYPTVPLIVSREVIHRDGALVSDSADIQRILALSAPGASTYFTDSSTSTRDEAMRMRALARPRGWTRLAVVTSPLHTRRACATFEAVGFSVTCVPAVSRSARDGAALFRNWLYETSGTIKYRSAGWIR